MWACMGGGDWRVWVREGGFESMPIKKKRFLSPLVHYHKNNSVQPEYLYQALHIEAKGREVSMKLLIINTIKVMR